MPFYNFTKRILLLAALILGAPAARGQDYSIAEGLMTRRVPNCYDISYNCVVLIPQMHERHSVDTISLLMNYWERQCGRTPLWYAYRILNSIDQADFKEELYNEDDIVGQLRQYSHVARDSGRYRSFYSYRNNPADADYCRFISSFASGLLLRGHLSPLEKLLVDFYASPDFEVLRTRLKADSLKGTILQNESVSVRKRDARYSDMLGIVFVGIWCPTGSLKVVGNHPFLGFGVGKHWANFDFVASVAVRFTRSPDKFKVQLDDSVFESDRFQGVYMGLDGVYALLKRGRHSLDGLLGLGYEGMSVLKVPETGAPAQYQKSHNSYNVNPGIGYRFTLEGGNYVSLQARYNLIHFNNKGGTDMSGNSISMGLVFGFVE